VLPAVHGDEGVQTHVQLARRYQLLAGAEGGAGEAAGVVHAGGAGRQVGAVGAQERLAVLRGGEGRGLLERRLRRLVGHAQVAAVGALVAPAGWVGGGIVHTGQRHGQAVDGADVAAGTGEDHRVVRRHRVPVVAGGVAALRQAGLVVAATADPRAGWELGRAPAHRLLQGADGLHARRLAIDGGHGGAQTGEVGMGVDQAGQEGAAAQVDDARARPGERPHGGVAAHRQDAPAAHGHRLGDVVGGVDRVYPAAGEDQIRVVRHRSTSACPGLRKGYASGGMIHGRRVQGRRCVAGPGAAAPTEPRITVACMIRGWPRQPAG
jgi:hypothetical protein